MSKNKSKLGQEPIVPTVFRQIGENEFRTATEKDIKDNYATLKHTEGMSKRFYAACQIAPSVISSLLSNSDTRLALDKTMKNNGLSQEEVIVGMVYEYVDELLKQE